MPALIEGILFGSLVIFLIGPVFFALIQTSIEKGFLSASVFALGVWISDVILLSVCWYGISRLAPDNSYLFWLGLAGGIVLIAFGLYSIINSEPSRVVAKDSRAGKKGSHFLKGFGFNGLNPMVMLFWSGVVSHEIISYDHDPNDRILFFTGVIFTMACGDLAKAFFASRLGTIMNPKLISVLNKVVGVLLVFFGSRLLYLSISNSL